MQRYYQLTIKVSMGHFWYERVQHLLETILYLLREYLLSIFWNVLFFNISFLCIHFQCYASIVVFYLSISYTVEITNTIMFVSILSLKVARQNITSLTTHSLTPSMNQLNIIVKLHCVARNLNKSLALQSLEKYVGFTILTTPLYCA